MKLKFVRAGNMWLIINSPTEWTETVYALWRRANGRMW